MSYKFIAKNENFKQVLVSIEHNSLDGVQGGDGYTAYYHASEDGYNFLRTAQETMPLETGYYLESAIDGNPVWAVATTSRNSNWWNCGVVPTTTASSASSVTIVGLTVKPGEPVRILERDGIIFSSVMPRLNTVTITNITGDITDYRGCVYFKSVDVAFPICRFDVYSDELCANKIAETTTFISNVTATPTITLTNGLLGTINIATSSEGSSIGAIHRVVMMKTGVCTAYTSPTLEFAGQAISLTAGNILEIWLGNPSLVIQYPIDIAGSYASATTSTAFQDRQLRTPYWDQSNAILCMVKARNTTNDTGATQAKIAMVINGAQTVVDGSALSLLSASRVSTVVEMTPNLQEINFGNSLEMRVIAGTNSNSQDLQGSAIFVLV